MCVFAFHMCVACMYRGAFAWPITILADVTYIVKMTQSKQTLLAAIHHFLTADSSSSSSREKVKAAVTYCLFLSHKSPNCSNSKQNIVVPKKHCFSEKNTQAKTQFISSSTGSALGSRALTGCFATGCHHDTQGHSASSVNL